MPRRPPILPAWNLFAASQRLFIWGCLSKSRATYCTRDVIDPGHIFPGGEKVALRFSRAGPHSVPLLTAFPADPAAVWPPKVRFHVAKAAIAPI